MQEIPTKRHGVLRSEHCMDPTCRGQRRQKFRPPQRLFYADLIPFYKPYNNSSIRSFFFKYGLIVIIMHIISFKHKLKPPKHISSLFFFFVKTAAQQYTHNSHQ